MASFWAGLVRFGLQFGLGCVPNAAFWRAHKPNRKYKPTVQLAYKRPRKPNPNIRDRSDLDLVLPMMLSKASPEYTLAVAVGLVHRSSEASMEVLPMAVTLDGIYVGSDSASLVAS